MDYEVVHSFPKNDHEEIRISLREYKDRHYIDLRLFFQPDNEPNMVPSKKGLTIGAEYCTELARGLSKFRDAFQDMKKQGEDAAHVPA